VAWCLTVFFWKEKKCNIEGLLRMDTELEQMLVQVILMTNQLRALTKGEEKWA
jgi:hypothetical protein